MIHGILKTAAPLTEEQVQRIEQGFTDKMGNFVSFEIQLDPRLIGGFVATLEGIVYDASIRAQLEGIGRVFKG